jgi:hypothetical protein
VTSYPDLEEHLTNVFTFNRMATFSLLKGTDGPSPELRNLLIKSDSMQTNSGKAEIILRTPHDNTLIKTAEIPFAIAGSILGGVDAIAASFAGNPVKK